MTRPAGTPNKPGKPAQKITTEDELMAAIVSIIYQRITAKLSQQRGK